MTAEQLGLDAEAHRAAWPPNHMTFQGLNDVLQRCQGAAKVLRWKPTGLSPRDVFMQPHGTFALGCIWVHSDNREGFDLCLHGDPNLVLSPALPFLTHHPSCR